MTVTAYLRDRGVICYEAPLFDDQRLLAGIPQQLLSTGLDWYWESARTAEAGDSSQVRNLPPTRPLTQLTHDSVTSLHADLRDRDVDGYGRFVAIVGVDPDTTRSPLDHARLRTALEAFIEREEGPIRIVVCQIGDTPRDYIFAPHDPIEPVRGLLEGWQVIPSAIRKTYPYEKLRTVKLESLFDLVGGE